MITWNVLFDILTSFVYEIQIYNVLLRGLNFSSWQIVYRQSSEEMNTSRILECREKISLSTWIIFHERPIKSCCFENEFEHLFVMTSSMESLEHQINQLIFEANFFFHKVTQFIFSQLF
jgi:hypothetical protein